MFKIQRLLRLHRLMNEEDGGDGSGDSGGGGDADKVAALETTLNGVIDIVKTLASGQTGLQDSIKALNETVAAGMSGKGSQTDDEDPIGSFNEDDLETMPRKDLIAYIQSGTAKLVKDSISPIGDQIKGLSSKLDESISSSTVKDFEKDHTDLMEWRAEIGDIFKSGRATNVNDAYRLARLDNPSKAEKIDLKYKPAVKSDNVVKLGFQGFPPANSGKGEGKNTRMTPNQAAEAAWEEATAQMPGIEQFLNSSST